MKQLMNRNRFLIYKG